MKPPNGVLTLLTIAREILDDPDLSARDIRRIGAMSMSAVVATCPGSLPDEYERARELLRPHSGPTPDELRAVVLSLITALEEGEWDLDDAWIVEVALHPLQKLQKEPSNGGTEERDL